MATSPADPAALKYQDSVMATMSKPVNASPVNLVLILSAENAMISSVLLIRPMRFVIHAHQDTKPMLTDTASSQIQTALRSPAENVQPAPKDSTQASKAPVSNFQQTACTATSSPKTHAPNATTDTTLKPMALAFWSNRSSNYPTAP